MPVQVSVIVAADSERSPNGIIGTVDNQSMPTDQFELAVVDLGLDDEQRRRLDRLAAHRPNVRVLSADDDWPAQLAGAYVLEAGHDHRLFPDALNLLLQHALFHGLDAVAGRVVQLGQPFLDSFLRDEAIVHGDSRATALSSPLRLLLRDRVRRENNKLVFEADGAEVGILATYPAGHTLGRAQQPALTLTLDQPDLTWQGGDLRIEAAGSVSDAAETALVPVLLVRQLGSFLTHLLPSEGAVEADAGDAGRRWQVASTFSPLSAARGAPLPRGQWQVDVVLAGTTRGSSQVRLPGTKLAPALLDGLTVVPADGPRNTLHLDIGPTRLPIIDQANTIDASVTESAAGSLLRVRLPEVHVQTTAALPGTIALDRFQLPAAIETSSGTAILTAFVSGLAGAYEISTKFGSAPLQPIGMTLQISGDGTMTVLPTPAKPAQGTTVSAVDAVVTPARAKNAAGARGKKTTVAKRATKKAARSGPIAKPSPSAGKRKAAARAARGPIARLRRGVPPALEPQIRKLRKQPLARALYRRVTGLTGAKTSSTRSR